MTMLDQERGGAAGAVARDLGRAAIGIVKLDGAIGFSIGWRIDHDPAIGANAGVAVANGAAQSGVAVLRSVLAPGQEKIVLGAVGLREWNFHRPPGSAL